MNDTKSMEVRNEIVISDSGNNATARYSNGIDFVKVAKIREKLDFLLSLEVALRANAEQHIAAVLENAVRVGWCLIDIKSEMRGEFNNYAENHLPFSHDKANRLMKAARNFQRDTENHQFLESIWTKPLAIEYTTESLSDQIGKCNSGQGARHFQDLLVTSGLAPAKQITDASQRITPTSFFKLLRAIDSAVARLVRYQRESPIENLSEEDREIIRRKLQPLVDLVEGL